MAKKNEKDWLTLDCHCIKRNITSRFRTQADNAEEQTCYFSIKNNDKLFHTILSEIATWKKLAFTFKLKQYKVRVKIVKILMLQLIQNCDTNYLIENAKSLIGNSINQKSTNSGRK